MAIFRAAAERGTTRLSWLDSRHTFSFGDYYDPRHLGVSALRVINDDLVVAGAGFGTHGHRDMEILTYVTDGVIAHEDSAGNREQVPAGEFQLMHAGRGIRHSEFNASQQQALRFLQIWIEPAGRGGEPGYEQKDFPLVEGLQLVVSPDGREGSLTVRQDACVYRASATNPVELALPLPTGRRGYLHVVRGGVLFGGRTLLAGDGVAFDARDELQARIDTAAEFLFFDLPA
jgi:redox-sensitive bicupin YhaK (pirin superfamily)